MRKLVVLLAVSFAVLISGCAAQDPVQIIRDSAAKLENLSSYQIDYDYSMSMLQLIEMDGDITIYKKGDKMRSDTEMSMMDVLLTINTYYLPTGTFSCVRFIGNITCMEGESGQLPLFKPEKSLDVMESMIGKDVVSLGYLNTRSIAGRSCHNISFEFDVSKLSLLTQDEQSVLGMNSTTITNLEAVETLKLTQCYDSETGVSLAMRMFMKMDMSKLQAGVPFAFENITVEMDMTASSFKPNEAISDSVFELPAEVAETVSL